MHRRDSIHRSNEVQDRFWMAWTRSQACMEASSHDKDVVPGYEAFYLSLRRIRMRDLRHGLYTHTIRFLVQALPPHRFKKTFEFEAHVRFFLPSKKKKERESVNVVSFYRRPRLGDRKPSSERMRVSSRSMGGSRSDPSRSFSPLLFFLEEMRWFPTGSVFFYIGSTKPK